MDQEGCSDTLVNISSNRGSSEVLASIYIGISVDDDEAVDDENADEDDVAVVGVNIVEYLSIELLSVPETGNF